MIHQGSFRSATKYESTLRPARRWNAHATKIRAPQYSATITQSISRIDWHYKMRAALAVHIDSVFRHDYAGCGGGRLPGQGVYVEAWKTTAVHDSAEPVSPPEQVAR